MRFSANLGFLWANYQLPEAIQKAKDAGFDAVECHWPYKFNAYSVRRALDKAQLLMLGLNTQRGKINEGENGLAALPTNISRAREAIDEAITYATITGTPNIHVMAGFSRGKKAHETFVENLRYACSKSASTTFLIEPLNTYDAPGYFLQTTEQAISIIDEVDCLNLKLMFDCYHIQLMEGNLSNRLAQLYEYIGHIQIASVPDRGSPDHGEINYTHIFDTIKHLGWEMPLGVEYKPNTNTESSLKWLKNIQKK